MNFQAAAVAMTLVGGLICMGALGRAALTTGQTAPAREAIDGNGTAVGDWRPIGEAYVEEGLVKRQFADAASLGRDGKMVRLRVAEMRREPGGDTDGKGPVVGAVLQMTYVCGDRRGELRIIGVLRAGPGPLMESFHGAGTDISWREPGVPAPAAAAIACGDTPMPPGPGAQTPQEAGAAWVAGNR